MTPCSREFYKKENLYKIYRIPGELGTKTADMLRLCVLLVAARAVASSVMDCSGTLNLAQSEILCNSSTSGGRITHTATNTSIDCRGAYLNGYKTTQARDIVISDCRVDAPSFTGVSSEALIRNCVLNGTTFYAGAAIYFERTHLKYIAVSGAADYNITIGPRSSVLTIVVVSGAKMLVDYEGEEKTQLTINSDGLCAVRRFPPASILCAITRKCTYSGMFFFWLHHDSKRHRSRSKNPVCDSIRPKEPHKHGLMAQVCHWKLVREHAPQPNGIRPKHHAT
jgi:hypothetical protein